MLDYTIELITLAASNSLAVFCFCNLIIAILLVGGSKSSPEERKPTDATPTIVIAENFKKIGVDSSGKAGSLNKAEMDETASSVSIDMVENGGESPDDGEDDELRKRAEEFIERVNRGWRAEKMETFYLGQQKNSLK